MASKLTEAFESAAAIAKGMSITFGEMMNPTITEDYPDSPPKFQERYRGAHVLQRDENGLEKCVACFLCAGACPADCIYIEAAENTDQLRISGGERYAKPDIEPAPGDLPVVGDVVPRQGRKQQGRPRD